MICYNNCMNTSLNTMGPNGDFESIKHVDENGVEFWDARELFSLLGYSRWEDFEKVITRATEGALISNQTIENHFRQAPKMIDIDRKSTRLNSSH